ncbi:hypothetical protein IPH19_03380 [Candidatus Uhrbacteria bacterium]|nr:MAG: hypothetical protein IPH19_03380 [Candidatus Uhrbacteria bacterium]
MPRSLRPFLIAFTLLLGGLFLSSSAVLAAPQINNQINYQARLMDSSGFPVADGNYSVYLSLYDASTAGTRLWTATGTLATPTPLTVNVQNGLFTVLLGDTSAAGGSQNTLDTVNWNSDQLYLGVTINADAEMSPRKRFASAPQAFNARQLQGMYASSTASGGQTLFTLNQTQNDAATGTRSTLDVRSNGTSNSNDFLIRGINDANAVVFSINRQGSVTSTNVFVSGLTSSTNLNANIASFATATVAGQGICLSNGQFCSTGSVAEADTLQTVSNRGSFTTTTLTLFGGLTTSNITATGTLNVTGASTLAGVTFTNATGINATTTNLFAANLLYTASTGTSAFVSSFGFTTASGTSFTANIGTFATATVAGRGVCLSDGTFCPASTTIESDTLLTVSNRGSIATSTLTLFGGFVAASSSVTGTLNISGSLSVTGTSNLQSVHFTHATGTSVTSTNVTANIASFATATVAGQGICLSNGVGCVPAAGETDTLAIVTNRGSFATTTVTLFGGLTVSNIIATGTLNVSGVSSLAGLTFTNATGVNATTTGYLSFNVASGTTLLANALNFGSGAGGSLNITTALTVNGVNVCLQDNTNCPVSGGSASDGNWVFNSSTQQLYQVTTTLDVLIGGSSQPSSPFVFLNNTTDSRLVVGGGTALADVVIGAATSSGLNTAFQLTGDDLFVQGNIGSVSSVYTNGAFIAGSGSTVFGNGYINKNDGNLTIDASGGFITPSVDLAVSLGSVTNRYNGVFGNTTSTHTTTTSSFVSTMGFQSATGLTLIANTATFATATVSGQAICLFNGVGCPVNNALTETLQSVTARGSFTTTTAQFFGGFVAASSSVTGTFGVAGFLNVTGSMDVALTATSNPVSIKVSFPNANDRSSGLSISTVGSSTGLIAQKIRAFGQDLSAFAFTDDITDPVSASGALAYYSHTSNAFALSLLEAGLSMSDLTLYNTNNGGTQSRAAVEIKNNAGVSSTAALRLANDIDSAGIVQHVGVGCPEGLVYAEPGSIFFNNGGTTAGTQAYLKTADAGSNGWVGIVTLDMLASGLDTLQSVTARGSFTTTTAQFFGGFVAASSSVTGTFAVVGTSTLLRDVYVGTSTYDVFLNSDFVLDGNDLFAADNIGSVSSIFSNGMLVTGETDPTLFGNGFIKDIGALVISTQYDFFNQPSITLRASDTVSAPAGDINIRAGDASGGPPAGNIYLTPGDADFGNPGHLYFQPVTGSSNTPQFRFTSVGGGFISLESPSTSNSVNFVLPFADGASSTVIGTNGSGALTFVSVCLTDGTNCPAGIGSDLNWTFNLASDFVRNATATTDIAIGSSTIGNAPFAFLNNTTTSRLLIGQNTTTGARADLVIGATTSSGMNTAFQLTGDDLFVAGNIGSASSVYTNGAFIAGSGSTLYGDGYIARTTGDIVVSASSNVFRPSANNTLNLGSVTSSFRNIYASGTIAFGTASGSALNLVNPVFTLATSSNFTTFPTGVAVRNNIAYLADSNFVALDVSNPSNPTLISTLASVNASDLTLAGDYAYVAADGLKIIDISRPGRPVQVGYYANGLGSTKPVISGQYAYMGGQDFQIVDISSPTAPTSTAIVTLTGSVGGVDVQGKFAYVANDTTFRIYDITDPSNPTATGTLGGFNNLGTVIVSGQYAYVVNDGADVVSIDISNPAAPVSLDTYSPVISLQLNDITLSGRYLYLSKHVDGIEVLDITDPNGLIKIAEYNTPGAAFGMMISGKYLYVADFGSGLAILDLGGADISSAKIGSLEMGSGQVLNNLDIGGRLNVAGGILAGIEGVFSRGPLVGSSVIVGATSFATSSRTGISSNGKQIAVHNGITAIYDGELITSSQLVYNISDPVVPVNIANILAANDVGDLVFKNDYLYQVGATINVYDISSPSSLELVATSTGNAPYAAFLSGGYLYVTRDARLAIYDISDATRLTELGTAQLPCTLCLVGSNQTNGLYVKERYAYMTDIGTDNFYIIDVSDPYSPTHTSYISGFSNPQGVVAEGNYAYMVESGSNELTIINIASSTEPFVARSVPSSQSAPTEVALSGNYLYVGGSTGVAVFDVSSSTNPFLVTTLASGSVQDMQVEGNQLHVGTASAYFIYEMPSITAPAMLVGSVQAGTGLIENDFTIGNQLYVGGGIHAGGSIMARGSISASDIDVSGFGSATAVRTVRVASQSVYAAGDYVYTTNDASTRVHQISIANPEFATNTAAGVLSSASGRDLFVAGGYLYVAQGTNGLAIFSTENATGVLRQISTTTGLGTAHEVFVSGRYAYIAALGTGVEVVDVGNPYTPVLKETFDGSGTNSSQGVYLQDRYLYVGDGADGLRILDASDPVDLRQIGILNTAGSAEKVFVSEGIAYVTDDTNGLVIVDVSNPASPRLLSTVPPISSGNISNVTKAGDYLYVTSDTGLGSVDNFRVFDVSSSTRPVLVWGFNGPGSPAGVDVKGRYAYVGDGELLHVIRLPGVDAPSANIGSLFTGQLNVAEGADIGSYLNVKTGLSVGNGGIQVQGPSTITGSSTDAILRVRNAYNSSTTPYTAWGILVDSIAVSPSFNVPPANRDSWSMYIDYSSSSNRGGLCVDDAITGGGCPISNIGGRSIMTDAGITANAFDLAERYSVSGTAEGGDLLVLETSTSTMVTKHSGTMYDPKLIGIVSLNPGFELGWFNPSSTDVAVALTGRVPTKISMNNGPVQIGDPLTSSDVPGYAMKATKPGMIIGHALQSVSATGTAEVFVAVGYWAGSILATDGTITTIHDDLTITASVSATDLNPTSDSWGLTFRGEAWDASSTSVVASSFTLLTDILSATTSRFSIRSTSGTDLLSIDQVGNASVAGSLSVAGKFYPSSKGGGLQDDWYVFVDDTSSTAAYISTNAEGWQSMDTYDFAERYYSPDSLEPGDVVIVSDSGRMHVQRSMNDKAMVLGIVSTRPAFIAGRPATSTYPIALSGRVPTKVSGMNGAVKAGDPLAPTSIPGVVAKAIHTGPIVGLALEDYDQTNVGSIEVFVNPGWWTNQAETNQETIINNTVINNVTSGVTRRGVGMIVAGSKRVHISFDSIGAYPFVQVTPRGLIQGNWGTDGYSDTGFDILMSAEQTFDAYFSWQVEPLQGSDRLNLSDGTSADIDPVTGLPFGFTTPTTTESIIEESPMTTSTEALSGSESTSTDSVTGSTDSEASATSSEAI